MADKLAWGIIGTGDIAKVFAKGLAASRTGRLLAIGSRTQGKAERFGDEFGAPRRYGSYEALLADKEVEAVYISTPHPLHAEWAIKSAEAGKHVLCEKPIGMNHPQAMAIVEAAIRNDVFLMEAFMYRCHPQTAKLVELVRDKTVGEARVIHATFSFHAGYNLEGRLLNNALGGGGILDVGCYCTSLSRLVAGAALGRDFAEPIEVKGCGRIGPESRVDEWAIASLRFDGDILAQVAAGVQLAQENVVRIFGSDGYIFVPAPWMPGRDGSTSSIFVHRRGREPREISIKPERPLYAIEADTVAEHLERRQPLPPAMTWDDTLGNMKTLDAWRDSFGMVYDAERAERVGAVHGRPLQWPQKSNMKYGEIKGVGKPLARLIMGTDYQREMRHAAVMFDDYFERGGNCFDTAYIYGSGASEKVLGQWIRNRGIREQVLILGKGAHTPHCNPEALSRQLLESLDRLQTDYVDIYMLHRDNPEVPAGEFMDVLNEHVRAGRIRAFGGSNWSMERVDAANEYAARNGLVGMAAVNNNFSLARLVQPPWDGCLASSEPAFREWHKQTQMPLLAWSSQARGFFIEGRAHPEKRSDAELVRCWYSDDNFQRLERARELARKKGVLALNIALAYVLCQQFPTFPLIGPRLLSETRTSWPALAVELTPEEVAWLNLED